MRARRSSCTSLRGVLLVVLIGVSTAASASAATSPEAVRACVEDNLARYSDPANAVRAQYADIEATCRSAIETGDVVVEFAGDGEDDESGGGATSGRAADAPADPRPESTGPARNSPRPAPAEESTGGGGPDVRDPAPTRTTSAALVVRSAASGTADAGDVLPPARGDGPAWLFMILGAGGALVLGAAVIAVRRRLN